MALAQVWGAPPRPRTGGPSGLADVLDVLLDKGLVLDAFVRVSLIGIELLTVDARVVIASVDTYLRFAEAVNRLDLYSAGGAESVPTLVRGEARSKTRKALGGGGSDGEGAEEGGSEREEESREEREERKERGDEESGGGLRGAIGKVASKARERGKWD